ncbi:MAG: outer membrane protein assembly factor BamE [Gammaproteobacteria bacterium]|nr:outer membrane protein assembly factor BamE [Gammaproteobacteria bacterium]
MKQLTFFTLVFVLLSGCSTSTTKIPELPKIKMPSWLVFSMPEIELYKPTITEGSDLDIESVKKIKIGMTKDDVINLIGTPSINDPFHQDQWDYIHHSSIDGERIAHYRLTLIFSGNFLAEIDSSGLDELVNSE